MMIQNLKMTQTEETKEKSELAIVFKKIRTSTPVTVNVPVNSRVGPASKATPTSQNGNIGIDAGDAGANLNRSFIG